MRGTSFTLNTLSNCTRSNQMFSLLQRGTHMNTACSLVLNERGRMYTIYKQVPKGQHQIKFGSPQKFSRKTMSLTQSICHVTRLSLGVLMLRSPEVFLTMLYSPGNNCFASESSVNLRQIMSCRSTYPTLSIVVT